MDSHRRSSIVEPTGGGYVPDTRSQLNTVRNEYFHSTSIALLEI